MLPTTRDLRQDSVEPAWRDRFEAVLAEVEGAGHDPPLAWTGEAAYREANRAILGTAAELAAAGGGPRSPSWSRAKARVDDRGFPYPGPPRRAADLRIDPSVNVTTRPVLHRHAVRHQDRRGAEIRRRLQLVFQLCGEGVAGPGVAGDLSGWGLAWPYGRKSCGEELAAEPGEHVGGAGLGLGGVPRQQHAAPGDVGGIVGVAGVPADQQGLHQESERDGPLDRGGNPVAGSPTPMICFPAAFDGSMGHRQAYRSMAASGKLPCRG